MGMKDRAKYLEDSIGGFDSIDKGKKIERVPIKAPEPKMPTDKPKEVIPPSKGEPGYEEWLKKVWG